MYSIFEEADKIIDGIKREEYGDLGKSFLKIASMWGDILGMDVTRPQVALCMIAIKLSREAHKHKRDNLVDICGYVKCLEKLQEIEE